MSLHVIEIESDYFSCLHVACIAQTFFEPCRCVRRLIKFFNNFVRLEIEVVFKQIDGSVSVAEIYD